MGNPILEYYQKLGEERKGEETAKAMLADNLDPLDIIKYTGISVERLRQLRDGALVSAS